VGSTVVTGRPGTEKKKKQHIWRSVDV
jgi:hypothetical protein